MDLQQYLSLTEELSKPDLDATRRTQILMELTEDYKETTSQVTKLEEEKTKLGESVETLTHANSLLFRKFGAETLEVTEKVKEVEKSQSITLEDIERNA